jgi:hypothetical protein
MISKCIAFLIAALVLSSCCALGGGCAPTGMSPVAMDGDGLGAAPPEEEAPPPDEAQPKQDMHVKKQDMHIKRKKMAGSPDAVATEQDRAARGKEQFEMEQAADEADDQKLKRKLVICSDCMSPKSTRDDMMGGSSR